MTDAPDQTKLTRTKQRWAETGQFLTGRATRPEEERLPPGQRQVLDWPVLDLGVRPDVPTARWQLRLFGAVREAATLDWATFQALPQMEATSDIHCVTTWSRYDNAWRGVATRTLLDLTRPQEDARFVILHSYDGYTARR